MIRWHEVLLLATAAAPGLLFMVLSMTIEPTDHFHVDRSFVGLIRCILLASTGTAGIAMLLAVRWFSTERVRGPTAAAAGCLAGAFLFWAVPVTVGFLDQYFR